MAFLGVAPADGGEASELFEAAWELRWRAPELALVLGERAAKLATLRRDEPLRLRSDALVVFALNRLGRGAEVVERALPVLRDAESAGEQDLAWRLRVELARAARAVGAPLTGFGILQPMLSAGSLPPALRAGALVELTDCLGHLGRGAELAAVLDEADQLYQDDPDLEPEIRQLHRALLRAVASARHRRRGDFPAAVAAAEEGLALLGELADPALDGGHAAGNLTLELVRSLLDSDRPQDAAEIARPVLEQPVRAVAASPAGWLRVALATRLRLPAGELDGARTLLLDAVNTGERHRQDALLAESLTALSQVYELDGESDAALQCLRTAYAAERRRQWSVHTARLRLAERFAAGHKEFGGLQEQVAALLSTRRPVTRPVPRPSENDELAGWLSRAGFQRRLNAALDTAQETDTGETTGPLALAVLGVDRPAQQADDTHLHSVGDQVLRRVAETLREAAPRDAVLGRLDGDRLAVLLPDTSQEQAEKWADRVRDSVTRIDWSALAQGLDVTVSAGVAMHRPGGDRDTLLAAADRALQAAKDGGRNRVVVELPVGRRRAAEQDADPTDPTADTASPAPSGRVSKGDQASVTDQAPSPDGDTPKEASAAPAPAETNAEAGPALPPEPADLGGRRSVERQRWRQMFGEQPTALAVGAEAFDPTTRTTDPTTGRAGRRAASRLGPGTPPVTTGKHLAEALDEAIAGDTEEQQTSDADHPTPSSGEQSLAWHLLLDAEDAPDTRPGDDSGGSTQSGGPALDGLHAPIVAGPGNPTLDHEPTAARIDLALPEATGEIPVMSPVVDSVDSGSGRHRRPESIDLPVQAERRSRRHAAPEPPAEKELGAALVAPFPRDPESVRDPEPVSVSGKERTDPWPAETSPVEPVVATAPATPVDQTVDPWAGWDSLVLPSSPAEPLPSSSGTDGTTPQVPVRTPEDRDTTDEVPVSVSPPSGQEPDRPVTADDSELWAVRPSTVPATGTVPSPPELSPVPPVPEPPPVPPEPEPMPPAPEPLVPPVPEPSPVPPEPSPAPDPEPRPSEPEPAVEPSTSTDRPSGAGADTVASGTTDLSSGESARRRRTIRRRHLEVVSGGAEDDDTGDHHDEGSEDPDQGSRKQLALGELLAEALVAYETSRREHPDELDLWLGRAAGAESTTPDTGEAAGRPQGGRHRRPGAADTSARDTVGEDIPIGRAGGRADTVPPESATERTAVITPLRLEPERDREGMTELMWRVEPLHLSGVSTHGAGTGQHGRETSVPGARHGSERPEPGSGSVPRLIDLPRDQVWIPPEALS
ncbi:MAG TPA: diguanylate cyclase [Pseudonocardiaceae bacterium]